MINDHNIAWIRKRKYFSWTELHNLIEAAGVLSTNNDASQLPTLTAQTLTGIALVSAENFDAWVPCPYDLNPAFPVGLRVRYAPTVTTPATLTTLTLTALLDAIISNGLIALATTVLNTVLGSQTYGPNTAGVVSNLFTYSSRGIKNTLAITRTQVEAGAWLAMRVTPSAFVNVATFKLLGIEIDYVPIKCQGQGSELDAPLSSN